MENTAPNIHPLLSTQQDNTKTLILILGIMAFLAGLALVFLLSTQRLHSDWKNELGRSVTVQVMLENTEVRDTKIANAISVLETQLPDAKITELSLEYSRSLLKPWLGSVSLPDDLPLPALITIELSGENKQKIVNLAALLANEGLIAEIDDHSRWSDQIGKTGRGLKTIALTVLSLIFTACAAVSVYATQAALTAQHDVLRVLVQVGASDKFITKLLIKQAAKRGLWGGVIGVSIGGVTSAFLSLRQGHNTALLPDLTMHWADVFGLLCLIISITLLCAIAAGVTAINLLRQEHRRI